MSISIESKLQAVVDSVKNRYSDEAPIRRYARIAIATASLASGVVGSLDETNKTEDLKNIRKEISDFSQRIAIDLDVPWGMESLIPILVGVAVSKLETITDDVEKFKTEVFAPFFQTFKDFGEAGLEDL